jgi:hypothetical protein
VRLRAEYVWVFAASVSLAGALGGGACGGSGSPNSSVPPNPNPTPPAGDKFAGGVTLGSRCTGFVIVAGTVGYAFCENGVWSYTDTGTASPWPFPGDDVYGGDDEGDHAEDGATDDGDATARDASIVDAAPPDGG